MTLRQSQFVPPVPLLVAREWGLLDGVEIETTRTTGSPAQLAGLRSGDIDIAVTAIDNLFEWPRAGAQVRLVAQVEATTPLGVFARPLLEDLASADGSLFGVDAAANGFALAARYLLERAGVTARYVEIGGVAERLDALLSGEVDATLLGPPFDGLARGAGMRELARIPDLLPGFPGQGLVVRTGLVDTDELTAYLRALATAVEASVDISDADGEALLARNGFGSAAAAAWSTRPRRLDVDPTGLAVLTRIRAELGELAQGQGPADLHDPGPLARATAHGRKRSGTFRT